MRELSSFLLHLQIQIEYALRLPHCKEFFQGFCNLSSTFFDPLTQTTCFSVSRCRRGPSEPPSQRRCSCTPLESHRSRSRPCDTPRRPYFKTARESIVEVLSLRRVNVLPSHQELQRHHNELVDTDARVRRETTRHPFSGASCSALVRLDEMVKSKGCLSSHFLRNAIVLVIDGVGGKLVTVSCPARASSGV